MKISAALLIYMASAAGALAQNSPPVGNQFPVQTPKTGSYVVEQTDLKTVLPMNCSSPCTVTFPASNSSWPKGYAVLIQAVGSAAVTISATAPSTLYGMALSSGSVVLTTLGNFAYVTADQSNNYFASGVTGSGGGGGGGGSLALYSGGSLGLYSGGSLGLY